MQIVKPEIKDSIEYMIARKNISQAMEAVNIVRTLEQMIESEPNIKGMGRLMIYSLLLNYSLGAFHKAMQGSEDEQMPSEPIDALIFQLQKMKPNKEKKS